MAKGAATEWKVMVNNVNLSSWAHSVSVDDTRDQLDVSGFNVNNTREYVPGLRDQTVTVEFRQDFASGGPHQTLEPLYRGGSVFPFFVQKSLSAGTSASNPLYGGTASLYAYPPEAALNEVEELTIEFRPASNSAFQWGTTFPPP